MARSSIGSASRLALKMMTHGTLVPPTIERILRHTDPPHEPPATLRY